MTAILRPTICCAAFALAMTHTPRMTQGDILIWPTGETIPGTEGVIPGPGIDLSDRNTEERNLQYANLQGLNLSDARFEGV